MGHYPADCHIPMGVPKGEEREQQENIWRKNDWLCPKFGERHESTNSRAQWTAGKVNSKGPKGKHNQIVKSQRKQQERSNSLHSYKGSSVRLTAIFSSKPWRPEGRRQVYLKCGKKKIIDQKFYTQQKCPSKNEGDSKKFPDNKR